MPFFNRIDLKYELEDADISDVSDTNEYFTLDEPPESYYFEYTNELSSRISLVLTRDTRNSYIFPSMGNKVTLRGHVSGGVLGGDSETYGWRLKGEQYFRAWNGHVIALKGRVEVTDSYGEGELPVYDRLYVGGGRTIRGFDYRGVGPKLKREVAIPDAEGVDTEESIAVYRMQGGKSLAMASAEYVVPIVEKINLAAFIDSGNVWEDAYEFDTDELATSAGFELRFDMPQFPVKINYAWVISKDDEYTEEDAWGFWIGSGF
jgi:outer membrane protein insertion porin family